MQEKEIKYLTPYQHARLRSEMYLGSRVATEFKFPVFEEGINGYGISMKQVTFVPAILTAFREALDNHLDELSFVGKGTITVNYKENDYIETSDDGRGIPIDFDKDQNGYTASLLVSKTMSGRNFGERGEQAGTNGLGISVVNFCSEWFQIIVNRDKKNFFQHFSEGEEELQFEEPVIEERNSKKTGTTVRFKLSSKVFGDDLTLPLEVVRSLVIFIACTNPNIKFVFNGDEIRTSQDIKRNLFAGEKVVEFKFADDANRGSYFVKMTDDDTAYFSLVNNIPAYNGGTHDDEIKYHFPRQLLAALTKESKKRKLNPNKNDILDNLLFLGTMKVKAPNFDSQSKTRLTNKEAKYAIGNCLLETDWQKFIKDNHELVERIYERCAARTHQQDKSKIDQDEKFLKKLKIPSLIEANSPNRKECILFITEGESAKGGLNNVRNSSIHAAIPLRGKILNVYHKKPTEALKSEVIKQLCAVIGLVPGKKAEVEKLRYGKVFIMADADEDGQGSISPLVASLFYRFWPELFELDEPFIHIFSTPLIIAEKGKERLYFYPQNIEEFDAKKYKGWNIRRAKGLGSLQPENFKDHLDNPVSIPLHKDTNIKHVFDLLFNGGRADDRKALMEMTVEDNMKKIEEFGSDWNPTSNKLDL